MRSMQLIIYWATCWALSFTAVSFVAADDLAASNNQNTVDESQFAIPPAVEKLLQAKCVRCHNSDARKGELSLASGSDLFKGGESGASIMPGKPDESLLVEKIRQGEMPPDKDEHLSATEIGIIDNWVRSVSASESSKPLDQHDVVPILLRRCTPCHGRYRQEAKLDLRTADAVLRGGKSGPAIVRGKSSDSLLIQKIRSGEMPPHQRLVEASIKPIEPLETETLARWIDQGAVQSPPAGPTSLGSSDPLVDREFWSFNKPQPLTVPQLEHHADRAYNPIDHFVIPKLAEVGLELAPEADRVTLARRAAFDLTGLPPEPEALREYLGDPQPMAYERMIDRLLDSPHYGQRWARYWLDLAGYADSEGKREQDLPRQNAWRYRDYVIEAFNKDKPFDRFLREQIAGDELVDYESAPEITQEIYDNLVATGFLRMAPDPTWANITGYVPDRLEVMADAMDVLGSGVMGLTFKCARCHSHKFDPLPQRDYYRLVDIFKGALDEYNWIRPEIHPGIGPVSQDFIGGRSLPFVTTAERRAWENGQSAIDAQIAALKDKPDSQAQIKALESQRTPEPAIHALWDQGDPSPTYIYRRGDPLSPGQLVSPGVPLMLFSEALSFDVQPPWPGSKKTGRRLAFANWLTDPDHPLTARVAVNRLWKHHFGTGIVKTLGNFGKAGTPPTHPELLDWLAIEFVRSGWSTKAIHRLMMTSATYRQQSQVGPQQLKLDPDNQFYSRMPLVRLDAEALYDTMLMVAGKLDDSVSGPPVKLAVQADGLATPMGTQRGYRRLIYVQQQRKIVATHLENFDYPQMNPNCLERRDSLVAPQALYMLNNKMVYELAESFAQRIENEVGDEVSGQIDRAHLIALCRTPGDEERKLSSAALERLREQWSKNPSTDSAKARHLALTTYCHALLNSAAFLYFD